MDRQEANPLTSERLVVVGLLGSLVAASLAVFWAACDLLHPAMPGITIAVRGTAFLALFLLQVAVLAQPLARLHPVFRPLDRNRPLLVATVLMLGLSHAAMILFKTYFGGGDAFTHTSVVSGLAVTLHRALSSPANIRHWPFEPFGAVALLIVFLLVAAQHRFWRRNLGRNAWKGLQGLLYPAYAATLVHFALGFVQSEPHVFFKTVALAGPAVLVALYLAVMVLNPKTRWSPRRANAILQPAPTAMPTSNPRDGDDHDDNDDEGDVPYSVAPYSSTTAMRYGLSASAPSHENPGDPTMEIEATGPRESQGFPFEPGLFILFLAPLFLGGIATCFSPYVPGRAVPGLVTLEGIYSANPVPQLVVRPDWITSPSEGQHILLGGTGASGSTTTWADLEGMSIRVQGRLLYRGMEVMLQVDHSSAPFPLGAPSGQAPLPPPAEGETVTFSGELISMSCYLGTSWPAMGKLHQSCATRCLASGELPGLLIGIGAGTTTVVLAGPENDPLHVDASLAGHTVQVTGTFSRVQGFSCLQVDSIKQQD